MIGIVLRRPARAHRVVAETASPEAPTTLIPRGWEALHADIVAEFRRLGRVNASSVDDLVVERRWP